jgi:hypothetical protein
VVTSFEEPPNEIDVLSEAVDPLPRLPVRQSGHRVRRIDGEPGSQTELDPAVGDVVEREGLAGQHRRVAQRDLGDDGRKPVRVGGLRYSGKRRPCLEPWYDRIRPVDEVIGQRDDLQAEFLQPNDARLQFFPPDVRQEQHMEPQRVALAAFSHPGGHRSVAARSLARSSAVNRNPSSVLATR